MTTHDFVHLHTHSYFSLLDGAAPIDDLVEAAVAAGMDTIALTDHNGLYGAVRFYQAAMRHGVRPIIGAELSIEPVMGGDTPAHIVLLAQDNEGYSNLCRLITAARIGTHRQASPFSAEYAQVDRENPVLSQANLREHCSHLIALSGCNCGEIPRLVKASDHQAAHRVAQYYRELFGPGNFYIELNHHLLPPPGHNLRYRLADIAQRANIPVVATNNVHYVNRDYAALQDVLVCIDCNISVDERHPRRKCNCEYNLKSAAQMAELFYDMPEALRATREIADRCTWELDLGHLRFPAFNLAAVHQEDCGRYPAPDEGDDTTAYLRKLCYVGAQWRYGAITPQVQRRLEHELRIIEEQGLCDYFLIVWDIVRFARTHGIRATGRGSAGDSLVAHVLDLTLADPIAHELLFERFLSAERQGMPDIDIDFCSRRRDEINAYIYAHYGAEHVAAVCTVNTFRSRSAIREIGKVLGMSPEETGLLASMVGLPTSTNTNSTSSTTQLLFDLCEQISGFPRHLSVHVGGLIISREPLTDIMPLELAAKRMVIAAFDKDDVEALGMLKMDILALKIHSAIETCLDEITKRTSERPDIDDIPLDDEATYRLLRSTNTVGLFQLESPGQRNLLGRAQPREFEEVIANISLFRPGPVQADMIRPYLARRHGLESVTYLHPALEPILRRTFGVIIYQEQVIQIAQAIAGFTLGQGDILRRAMTHDRSADDMESMRREFIDGALSRDVERAVADQIFDAIAGFAAYGFNKAHAACFAMISYQTAYLKAHYPAEFLAGILSNQPMGFYPPRTVAEDAKRMGIGILPICANHSEQLFTVESGHIRTGLCMFHGLSRAACQSILDARSHGTFRSLRDFCQRTSVPRPAIENLILAGAFDFTGKSAPELMWELGALPKSSVGECSGAAQELDLAEADDIGPMPWLSCPGKLERIGMELRLTGVSSGPHPFIFWRQRLGQNVYRSSELYGCNDGDFVKIAGIVVARARPPMRSGKTAIFICLEDETGLVDAAVFEDCYERYGIAIYASPVLLIEGQLSRKGRYDISVTAKRVIPLSSWDELARETHGSDLPATGQLFQAKNGGR